MGAVAKTAGPRGEKLVKLEDFFVGPGKTALSRDEVLMEIDVPGQPRESHGAYLKHGPRNAMDIAIVNVAVTFSLHEKVCVNPRIVLGSVAPVPMRTMRAEAAINNKPFDETIIMKAATIASEECSPISDIRASADYRRAMVRVVVQRLFGNAFHLRPVKGDV